MIKINIEPDKLYKGCIFAAVVHAVMVGEYPELNYEHSWDGFNYNMNDSQGCRATVTFHPKYIIAVFQDAASIQDQKEVSYYFEGAPNELMEIARDQTLQYVLENVNGVTKPVITGAFWGDWESLLSNQTLEEIIRTGGHILHNQLLDYTDAFRAWDDYYGLSEAQMDLVRNLYQKKISFHNAPISLNKSEIKCLCGNIEECRESLRELNIFF